MRRIYVPLLLLAVALLIGGPPSLGLSANHSDVGPVVAGILVCTLGLLPLLAGLAASYPTPIPRRAVTRTALVLFMAASALVLSALVADLFLGSPSRCDLNRPGYGVCTTADLPWTWLAALAAAAWLGAVPLGISIILAAPRLPSIRESRQPTEIPNMSFIVRLLAILPFILAAWFFIGTAAPLFAFDGMFDYGENRIMGTVYSLVPLSLLMMAWPTCLALLVLFRGRLPWPEGSAGGKAFASFALGIFVFLAWTAATFADFRHDNLAVDVGEMVGAFLLPLVGASCLLPAAYFVAGTLASGRESRRRKRVELVLAETRSWYANGRIGPRDYERIKRACSSVEANGPLEASAAFAIFGSILGFLGLVGAEIMVLVIDDDRYGFTSAGPFSAGVLVASYFVFSGLRNLAKENERVDHAMAILEDMHENLVHVAGNRRPRSARKLA